MQIGARVKITAEFSVTRGSIGTIVDVYTAESSGMIKDGYGIKLDNYARVLWFGRDEVAKL